MSEPRRRCERPGHQLVARGGERTRVHRFGRRAAVRIRRGRRAVVVGDDRRGGAVLAGGRRLDRRGRLRPRHDQSTIRVDGPLRWSRTVNGAVTSSPLIADGRVYIGTRGGDLRAGRGTATSCGSSRPGRSGTRPPTAARWCWSGSDRRRVWAFDADTGRRRWAANVWGRVRSTPAVTRGRIYVGTDKGRHRPENRSSDLVVGRRLARARLRAMCAGGRRGSRRRERRAHHDPDGRQAPRVPRPGRPARVDGGDGRLRDVLPGVRPRDVRRRLVRSSALRIRCDPWRRALELGVVLPGRILQAWDLRGRPRSTATRSSSGCATGTSTRSVCPSEQGTG